MITYNFDNHVLSGLTFTRCYKFSLKVRLHVLIMPNPPRGVTNPTNNSFSFAEYVYDHVSRSGMSYCTGESTTSSLVALYTQLLCVITYIKS